MAKKRKGNPRGKAERAFAAREKRERAKDAVAARLHRKRDPKERRAEKARARDREIEQQRRELAKRKKPRAPESVERFYFQSKGRKYVKTVRRYKGVQRLQDAAVDLFSTPGRRRRAWAQLGPNYRQRADWVGSKVSSPQNAGFWLTGFGYGYARNTRDPATVQIETIVIEPVKGNKSGPKTVSKAAHRKLKKGRG